MPCKSGVNHSTCQWLCLVQLIIYGACIFARIKIKTKKTDTVLKETVKNLDSFQFRLHREYDKEKQA